MQTHQNRWGGVVWVASGLLACAGAPAPVAAPPSSEPATTSSDVAPASSASASAPSSAGQTSSAAERECNGQIDEGLVRQLSQRAATARSCYERLLQRDPKREGRLVVSLRLSSEGVVEQIETTVDEVADPEMTECVLGRFAQPLVGVITGGCADVNVPLRFKPKPPTPPPSASAEKTDTAPNAPAGPR